MKVHIPNFDPNKVGGGWTVTNYLANGLGNHPYEESDIFLITGATMCDHSQVEKAWDDGKKIVLRADNHLLPSRNRNTGMSRMKAFAEKADIVIFQSKWARDYLSPIIGKTGAVILNGVDTNIFKPRTKVYDAVYARSSRINEKGWEMARYWWSRHHNGRKLEIIGKFSGENMEYNFDFFNNERHSYWGELNRGDFAMMLGGAEQFLYSYFQDACSNTLLEARAAGCEIVDVYGMLSTGGAPEIMACEDISVGRMLNQYEGVLNELLS